MEEEAMDVSILRSEKDVSIFHVEGIVAKRRS
jgi:hypothetical protein